MIQSKLAWRQSCGILYITAIHWLTLTGDDCKQEITGNEDLSTYPTQSLASVTGAPRRNTSPDKRSRRRGWDMDDRNGHDWYLGSVFHKRGRETKILQRP